MLPEPSVLELKSIWLKQFWELIFFCSSQNEKHKPSALLGQKILNLINWVISSAAAAGRPGVGSCCLIFDERSLYATCDATRSLFVWRAQIPIWEQPNLVQAAACMSINLLSARLFKFYSIDQLESALSVVPFISMLIFAKPIRNQSDRSAFCLGKMPIVNNCFTFEQQLSKILIVVHLRNMFKCVFFLHLFTYNTVVSW
jgi:hypothetical protein